MQRKGKKNFYLKDNLNKISFQKQTFFKLIKILQNFNYNLEL